MTVILEHKPPVKYAAWPFAAEVELGTWPIAVPCARRFVGETLAAWGVSWLADDAIAVASELVTNAIEATWPHNARQAVKLWLMSDGAANLVIEVWDGAEGMPEEQPADVLTESGRGLAIVAELCRTWGVYSQCRGKVVWCLLCVAETA
jgi:Histidine kinase-like ATPase domain